MSDQIRIEEFEKESLSAIMQETKKLTEVGGWEWDLVKDVVTFSDNWLRMHGCSKRHARASELLPIAHPDDRPKLQKIFDLAVSEGAEYEIEYRIIHPDTGEERTIQACGGVKLDAEGNKVKLYGTAQDITERRQAEETLRRSQAHYRSVLDTINDGVVLQAASGEILTWNKGAEQIFGISAEEAIGQTSESKRWPTIHPDGSSYPGKDHPSMKTLRTGQPCRNEIMGVCHPSGQVRWVSINTNPLCREGDPKPYAVAISFSDITSLKKEKDRTEMLLNATNGGIWTWNFETNTLFFSSKYYQMLGYEPDAFPADYDHWVDLLHPDDREGALAVADEFLRTMPDEYENRFRLRTADGGYRWLRARAKVVERNAQGEAVLLVGNHEDITDLKQAEAAMLWLNKTLEQKVAERSKLAEERAKQLQFLVGELTLAEQRERKRIKNILHDHLQQLLVGAKIHSEVLSGKIGRKHKHLAEKILHLINQSLQASSSLSVELSPPVLQQGLSEALKWLGCWMNENHGLDVELQVSRGIDPKSEETTVLLFHSARELLFNVVKHAGVKSARVELSSSQEQLCVKVSDGGSGFDPAALQGMGKNGFGLLSIRERLELLGGSLRIESAPGKGASFSLNVPLKTQADGDEEGIQKAITEIENAAPCGDKISVLLVDHHAGVRQGLSSMLNIQRDIRVVGEAAGGREAIEKARNLQPDVILMDISMPGMERVEAIRKISAELPYIRIIGLSMQDDPIQTHRMIVAGASACCEKGEDGNSILSAIREGDTIEAKAIIPGFSY